MCCTRCKGGINLSRFNPFRLSTSLLFNVLHWLSTSMRKLYTLVRFFRLSKAVNVSAILPSLNLSILCFFSFSLPVLYLVYIPYRQKYVTRFWRWIPKESTFNKRPTFAIIHFGYASSTSNLAVIAAESTFLSLTHPVEIPIFIYRSCIGRLILLYYKRQLKWQTKQQINMPVLTL